MNWKLWLKWSWRDLRARWLQVMAIALIIALGTGVFAGLGGQETWRNEIYDTNYDRLHMYDLHLQLADGSYMPLEDLQAVLAKVDMIETWEPRLMTPTLVDTSHDDETIIVRGQIIGMNVDAQVNQVYVTDGRTFQPADSENPAAIVEYKFARHYNLKPGDSLRISGDIALDYIGTGHSPEYFIVRAGQSDAGIFGESSFAVIFMPLKSVQAMLGREDRVNDAVILLKDGVDWQTARDAIKAEMTAQRPDIGVTLTYKKDDSVYISLYSDAEQDQLTWNLVALLFLIGAAFGAFNLAGRMVESQRRQIGVGMALGVPRHWIAFRPILVGIQIAILGTLFGLATGWVLGEAFGQMSNELLPLPYTDVSYFYLPGYFKAAAIGFILPLIAVLIPVWRAVRVQPIDAIKSGHLVARGGGLSWVLNVIRLPGRSFTQMPFRNVLRSPWRTLLTLLGIAVAIVLMIAFMGFLDTIVATLDRADDAYLHEGKDRMTVLLDFFYPVNADGIEEIAQLETPDGTPLFQEMEPALMVGGILDPDGKNIEVLLELHDMENAIWRPTLLKGELKSGGILLSEKAADDLGVDVGDTVRLEHPYREGLMSVKLVESEVPVVGIHNNPIRTFIYMDIQDAHMMGLDGLTNMLVLDPANGVQSDDVKRALLTQPGVASVQAVSEYTEAFDKLLEIFVVMFRLIEAVVLFMAFLIAFNSTSINVDERVREIATMFAFGLPIRTVTRMLMLENLITGILGTAVGVILGWVALNQILAARVEEQMADIKFIITIAPNTLILTAILGILVVMLTPLLSMRTLYRMDIPSTLRVME